MEGSTETIYIIKLKTKEIESLKELLLEANIPENSIKFPIKIIRFKDSFLKLLTSMLS